MKKETEDTFLLAFELICIIFSGILILEGVLSNRPIIYSLLISIVLFLNCFYFLAHFKEYLKK